MNDYRRYKQAYDECTESVQFMHIQPYTDGKDSVYISCTPTPYMTDIRILPDISEHFVRYLYTVRIIIVHFLYGRRCVRLPYTLCTPVLLSVVVGYSKCT